jgi:hypothetical protein
VRVSYIFVTGPKGAKFSKNKSCGSFAEKTPQVEIKDSTTAERECAAFPTTTYLVLRFAPGVDPKALQWLIKKIKAPRQFGGGELLLRRQPGCSEKEVNKKLIE